MQIDAKRAKRAGEREIGFNEKKEKYTEIERHRGREIKRDEQRGIKNENHPASRVISASVHFP